MHSALNRDGVSLQIDGLRVSDVGRCHVLLRKMDSRESAVDKHIVLDLATTADLQTMLKQVSCPLPLTASSGYFCSLYKSLTNFALCGLISMLLLSPAAVIQVQHAK